MLLLAVLAFGIGLRLFKIDQLSLWLDEIGEATVANHPFPQFFEEVRIGAGAAPLDYLGVKLTTAIFGHGTVATRLWSFVTGCAVILLAYLVGSAFFKRTSVGLIAAFMVSVSGFLVFYAQEARFYSLTALLGLVSLYLFNRAFERDRVRDWILFGASVTLCLYAHYFLAVVIAVEGIFLGVVWLWRLSRSQTARQQFPRAAAQVGRFLLASVGGGLLFLPWALFAIRGTLNWGWPALPSLDLPRFHQIATVLIALAPLNSNPTWNPATWARTDAVLGLALIGLVVSLRRGRSQALLLALAPPVMVVAAWQADRATHYFWSERQIIAALPMLYLLAAAGAAAIGEWLWRLEPRIVGRPANTTQAGIIPQSPAVAAFLISLMALNWILFNLGPLRHVYNGAWNNKEDWRTAAALITAGSCPDSRYYSFLDEHSDYGFVYYAPSLAGRTDWLYRAAGTDDVRQAVQRVSPKPTDWLVIVTGSATLVEGGLSADDVLRAQGFTFRELRGIRLYYHPPTCGPGSPR